MSLRLLETQVAREGLGDVKLTMPCCRKVAWKDWRMASCPPKPRPVPPTLVNALPTFPCREARQHSDGQSVSTIAATTLKFCLSSCADQLGTVHSKHAAMLLDALPTVRYVQGEKAA